MWIYEQSTGWWWKNGEKVYQGYSGNGAGLNNPAMQNVEKVGPLPAGYFTMGTPIDTDKHGPYFIPLIPSPKNEMFGRNDFGIHGDEILHPGQHLASEGCVIDAKSDRMAMYNSGDHEVFSVATVREEVEMTAT